MGPELRNVRQHIGKHIFNIKNGVEYPFSKRNNLKALLVNRSMMKMLRFNNEKLYFERNIHQHNGKQIG